MLSNLDLIFFFCFFLVVILFATYKSRKEKGREGYFLAGRTLSWPLIGISIVACNISTEQMVGMAGQAAGKVGLAVSAWQLVGAIGLVLVAFLILPRLLRAGIYTLPEYLEYRYCTSARVIMAVLILVIYVLVALTGVLFSGGITLATIFEVDLTTSIWMIGFIGLIYSSWGGLRAVAWADLIQGLVLLVGGLIVFGLGISACGGWENFNLVNADKLKMILPASHAELPWTGVISGMWVAVIYYCGLNQVIMQRSLAAKSLHDSQMGLVFASGIWLLVPFIIVMPGIMAEQLYPQQLSENPDRAFPLLIGNLIPAGLRGFMLATISAAVVSSVSAILMSTSTIFAIDIYQRLWNVASTQAQQVRVGRIAMVGFIAISCSIAPAIARPEYGGVYQFIQQFQGYIWPGVSAAFLMGWAMPKAPPAAGLVALMGGPIIYGIEQFFLRTPKGEASLHFLVQVFLAFVITCVLMVVITLISPLPERRLLPDAKAFEKNSTMAMLSGVVVVSLAVLFFIWYW